MMEQLQELRPGFAPPVKRLTLIDSSHHYTSSSLTESEKVEVKLSSTSSEGKRRKFRTPRMLVLQDGSSPVTPSSKRD